MMNPRSCAIVFVTAAALLIPVLADAQYANTLRGTLHAFVNLTKSRCGSAKGLVDAARVEGNAALVTSSQLMADYICTCLPGRAQGVIESLSDQELSRQVDETEFTRIAKPRIIDVCAGQMFRSMFDGDACGSQFVSAGETPEKMRSICDCMRTEVKGYSDAEASDIGLGMSNYLPRLAEARKARQPDPFPPPGLERLLAATKRCGGKL